MKTPLCLKLLISAAAAVASTVAQTPGCAYGPEFQQLQGLIAHLPAVDAIGKLKVFVDHHEHPACESLDAEELLTKLMRPMFAAKVESAEVIAQSVSRCLDYDVKSTRCSGTFEDVTAHPFTMGISPYGIPRAATIGLTSKMPGARLIAAYQGDPGRMMDGTFPLQLPVNDNQVVIDRSIRFSVLIAIFSTGGAVRYTKAAWYFCGDCRLSGKKH